MPQEYEHRVFPRLGGFQPFVFARLAAFAGLVIGAAPAQAFTFNFTYGSSVTNLGVSQAATITTAFNNLASYYSSLITNPITVYLDIESMTSGLGQSQTYYYPFAINYTTWRSALSNETAAAGNAIGQQAVASISSTTQPEGTGVAVTWANARALGFVDPTAKDTYYSTGGVPDSTISLNFALMDFTGSGVSGLYDFYAVAEHEIDEVLGINSFLSGVANNGTPPGPYVSALDQFRYSAPGVHTYSTDPNATAYFSVDGGVTAVNTFNQNNSYGDRNDWAFSGSCPQTSNQIQNAIGCPGVDVPSLSLASPEAVVLQALGYNMPVTVPEPGTITLLGAGLAGLAFARRRRLPV